MIKGETDLGDSVYARAEGNVIWLRTGSDQHIGLLPETLSELFRFAITSRFAPAPVEDPWEGAAKALIADARAIAQAAAFVALGEDDRGSGGAPRPEAIESVARAINAYEPMLEALENVRRYSELEYVLSSSLLEDIDAAIAIARGGVSAEIDYRTLLLKYIAHVGECEGVDFISDWQRPKGGVAFTDAEWTKLEEAAQESRQFGRGAQ